MVMLSARRSGCSGDRAVTPARWHGDRGGLARLQLAWGGFNFSFFACLLSCSWHDGAAHFCIIFFCKWKIAHGFVWGEPLRWVTGGFFCCV